MLSDVFARNASLRIRLDALIDRMPDHYGEHRGPIDVVVTPNEVNRHHGTGPLLQRLFRGRRNILSIRSRSDWGGRQDFGEWSTRISHRGRSRAESGEAVQGILAGRPVRTVVCAAYLPDDVTTAIMVQEASGASMCAYLMDDQNVTKPVIPDGLMREFLDKCCLRLATHPELRRAYERKYGVPFYYLPAVVPHELMPETLMVNVASERRGILLGSFWDQVWFDRLCEALAPSGYRIDWYGSNRSPWLHFREPAMLKAGIGPLGLIPEARLARELRKYPFAMVPVGMLDGKDTNAGVAALSLPGRILFAAGTSHTPILVVGSEKTCAARFVKHLGIGECVPYRARPLKAAMERLSDPTVQTAMRSRAAAVMPAFSDRNTVEWLEHSIQLGRPADARFEEAFAGYPAP
jgi:hypothetical protein